MCRATGAAKSRSSAYLERHGVPGIAGLDTRALVTRIRNDRGFQMGALSTDPAQQDADALVTLARNAPGPRWARPGRRRSPADAALHRGDEGRWQGIVGPVPAAQRPEPHFRVVAYDFGIKRNILRRLHEQGFDVTVVPARTSAEGRPWPSSPTPSSSRTVPATRPVSTRRSARRCASWPT